MDNSVMQSAATAASQWCNDATRRLALPTVILVGILTVAGWAYPWTAHGRVLDVPGEYATIQAGIEAAAEGDVVLVAVGYYEEPGFVDLDFSGKAIIVASEDGPERCVLRCSSCGHRGVVFDEGESDLALFTGFTIRDCCLNDESGAAVFISGASPVIANCIFEGNSVAGEQAYGGGVFARDGAPSFVNCLFIGNYAGAKGGALALLDSDAEIQHCTVTENAAGEGGGLYLAGAGADGLIRNSVIWANQSELGPGPDGWIGEADQPATLTAEHTDLFPEQPAFYIAIGSAVQADASCVMDDPLFAQGPPGRHCLSQTAAGQGRDSPCLNVGSDAAATLLTPGAFVPVGFNQLSTRTDLVGDTGTVDLGYHAWGALLPTPTPRPSPTASAVPSGTATPTVTPTASPGPFETPEPTPTGSPAMTVTPTETNVPTPTPTGSHTSSPTPATTPSPTASATGTPTLESPTPWPTAEPTAPPELGVRLTLTGNCFRPGDLFQLQAILSNPGPETLWEQHYAIMLDVYGAYFFYHPSGWFPPEQHPFQETLNLTPGSYSFYPLSFYWPVTDSSADGILIYGTLLNHDFTELIGGLSAVSFGWRS